MAEQDENILGKLSIDRGEDTVKRRHTSLPLLLICFLGLGLGIGVFLGRYLDEKESTAEVAPSPQNAPDSITPSLVENTAPSETIDNKLLDASGYVVARRMATVSSKTTGKIEEVFVEEGMSVKQGQILATLDAVSLHTQLELAQSKLKRAQANYQEVRNQLREAELKFERTKKLFSDKMLSEAEMESSEINVDALHARMEKQDAEISIARKEIELQVQYIEDSIIRAPFDGVVIAKNAQPGEIISPSTSGGGFTRTGICTLVDMDSLEIEVDVNEAYINKVFVGQTAEAQLDAYPEWSIPAEVAAIVPTADRQKATIKVRVKFLQLDPRILPDMGVKVGFFKDNEEIRVGQYE